MSFSEPEGVSFDRTAQFSATEVDEYGFALNIDPELVDLTNAINQKYKSKTQKHDEKWQSFLSKHPNFDRGDVKEMCRKGIPKEHRGHVWAVCSGSAERAVSNPGYYQKLVETATCAPETNEQIELDLPRTFPTNIRFRSEDGPNTLRPSLRRVLRAFACHNPRIGYCQSMNFIAAILLLFMNEELAFWTLVQIIDGSSTHSHLGLAGYYEEGMPLLKADIRVLSKLMESKLPKISALLKRYCIDLVWICTEWFMSLYTVSVPLRTVLRVWDSLLCEGYKVMFRVSMSMLKLNQEALLKCNGLEQIMDCIKSFNHVAVDSYTIMKTGFEIRGLSKSGCERERDVFKRQIEEERDESRRRREVRAAQMKQQELEREKQLAASSAASASSSSSSSSAVYVPVTLSYPSSSPGSTPLASSSSAYATDGSSPSTAIEMTSYRPARVDSDPRAVEISLD